MKTNDILLQSIKTLIQQEIEKAPFNKTKQGIITKNYMDGTYDVRFDGNLYTKILTYPNSTSLQLGQTVKIIIPNNQSSQMYISAEGSPLIYYPVGSYYETSDTSFNPNTTWGGTWELEEAGRVHVSAGMGYTIGSKGGEATHTLTVNEMPSHAHIPNPWVVVTNANYASAGDKIPNAASGSFSAKANASANSDNYMSSYVGGGQAHNNMQPYIVVNRWHRTA